MKKFRMSASLAQTVSSRIDMLEGENKYMKDFFKTISVGSNATAVDQEGDVPKESMKGVMIPMYLGQMDTFITNPQGVGVGVLSRMSETDPTVLASLQLKSQFMISKIGEYQHKNPKIQDYVRAWIMRMEGPTWQESLEAQSSFQPYGFSISEIGFALNKKMQKVPARVRTYHPSTLCFEVDSAGDVTPEGIIQFVIQSAQFSNPNTFYSRTQGREYTPFETPHDRQLPYRLPFIANYGLVRIPRRKVIHHVNSSMSSFGSPYGKACVRTAHLAWQLKVFFMKQLGVAGKRNAQPFLWGTGPINNNQTQYKRPDGTTSQMNPIENLREMLADREQDDALVTGPESLGYKIQAIMNQADLNQYLMVLQWLDTQIFRAFMLPSLIMTEGAAGSRSLGDKHFQIADRIAEADAQKFQQTIINQLVRPSIEANFGEQDDYGHFAQRPQSIEERERLANMFNVLSSGSWLNPADSKDGEYVRSTLHLPDQDESFYAQKMPNLPGLDDDDEDSDEAGEGDDDEKPEPKADDAEKKPPEKPADK